VGFGLGSDGLYPILDDGVIMEALVMIYPGLRLSILETITIFIWMIIVYCNSRKPDRPKLDNRAKVIMIASMITWYVIGSCVLIRGTSSMAVPFISDITPTSLIG
jgi:hypothetical protein